MLFRAGLVVAVVFLIFSFWAEAQEKGSRYYWRGRSQSRQNYPYGYQSDHEDRARSGSVIRENESGVRANHGYEVDSAYSVRAPSGRSIGSGRINYTGESESQGQSYGAAIRDAKLNEERAKFLSQLASGMSKTEASFAVFEAEAAAGRIPPAERHYITLLVGIFRELARTAADGARTRDPRVQSQKSEECRQLLLDIISNFKRLDRAVGGIQPEVYNEFMDKIGRYESALRRN